MSTSRSTTPMSSLKLALAVQRLREQVEGMDLLSAEPIAIVGMACRFPGHASSLEAYWQLLANGMDAITEVPADRWNMSAFYDPDRAAPGKMNTRWGGFLDQVDGFDAAFFGIAPREAVLMDPQQRLFLEIAYEALDDAGFTKQQLAGSQTGVFVACTTFDYSQQTLSEINEVDAHTVTGSMHCILPNRLSYLLGLHGLSLSLDTACSSSLVAIHLASQSLRNRESHLALAGGVNIILSPSVAISLAKWGMMAPDGRCKTFDASADGFVRSEGCGVIVLKRFSDALADGDRIYALIRGSAVNQDGHSTALTAPNGLAQQAVIRQALENAHVDPADVTYIEAHGTGTSLGDPIEVEALTAVYGQPRSSGQTCALASVKTNIGHLESASGIAGLIKVVLSMQHEVIPQHLHFQKLNPHISFEGTPFMIPSTPQLWSAGHQPRLAGISGFGFGGTNAHIILEDAPALPSTEQGELAQRPFLLPLSAQTPEALHDLARSYQAFLAAPGLPASLLDICYTASQRRTHYDHRAAVSGSSAQEIAERLGWVADGEARPGIALGSGLLGRTGKLAFIFSGQGPQWWGMGRELMAQEPICRQAIEKIDQLLRSYANWSLLTELNRSEAESRLDQTEIAQPAIFALQVGLAELWRSWGVIPAAVIGHSVGEIAAAYVAGVLTLEDAVKVVFHRARLMQRATGLGKMAAVEISATEAEREIATLGLSNQLSVAAINAPASVTLSGDAEALAKAVQAFQQGGISCRMLRVNYAFHSPQMEPYRLELSQVLRGLTVRPASIPILSTVTGQLARAGDYGENYWGQNIRRSVRFADAMQRLIDDGFTTFLEISPHPVLATSITQCLAGQQDSLVLASLRRGQAETQTLWNTVGELYAHGYPIQWKALYPEGLCVSLPNYPWQRQRYWFEPKTTSRPVGLPHGTNEDIHPLLGQKLLSPVVTGSAFQAYYTAEHPRLLADHRIFDNILVPGTAYLEMALAAAAQFFGDTPCTVDEFLIQEALALPENQVRRVQFVADPETGSFQVYSLEPVKGTWKQHSSGRIRCDAEPPTTPNPSLDQARQNCDTVISVEAFYQRLAALGIDLGSRFHGLAELWRSSDGNQSLARLQTPEAVAAEISDYRLHPALLDACFQTLGATFLTESESDDAWLPIGLDRFSLFVAPSGEWWCHATLQPGDLATGLAKGDLCLYNETGQLFATITGLSIKRTSRSSLQRLLGRYTQPEGLYTVDWQPESLPQPTTTSPQRWIIFSDLGGVGNELTRHLGPNTMLVFPGPSTQPLGPGQWQVDITSPANLKQLLENWHAQEAIHGMVYLWNLGVSEPSEWEISLQGTLHLVQALAVLPNPPRLFVATQGAQPWLTAVPAVDQAPAWGLARTIQLEHPELHCTCVDIDPVSLPGANAQQLAAELLAGTPENQVLYRNDARYVARLAPYRPIESAAPSVHLTVVTRGTFDNLSIRPKDRRQPGIGEIDIRVRATGVNFRDVLNTLGMYPGDPGPLGGECSGVITALGEGVTGFQVGDAVLGIAFDSFSTYAIADTRLVALKPPTLSFSQAASIPSVFLTAYYGLHHLAHIKVGDRVLIHAAAGGVGMAAVQLARRAGAIIFGTAGSPEKRAYMAAHGVDHPLDSRTLDFADQILAITQGQGVDIVLNSLAGEFISKSVACLNPEGCFLEIGKRDIWSQAQMSEAKSKARYFVYDLIQAIEEDPELIQSMIQELVSAISTGNLQPLPVRVFPLEAAENAFRYMAQAKHTGKLVLIQPADPPTTSVAVHSDATYLITGGMGGLGPILANGLVKAGARHIVLMGRHIPSETTQAAISQMETRGAQVEALIGDVSQSADVQRILEIIQQGMPPLKGILHAAGSLEDGVLLHQSWSRFAPVLVPKTDGVRQLHKHTLDLPLDFFILFSSAAAVIGSPGQANYAAANAYLDSFASFRSGMGFPALSIGWGGWGGTGMAARLSQHDQQRFARLGLGVLTPEQGVAFLDSLLSSNGHVVALPFDWDAFIRSHEDRSIAPLYVNVARSTASKTATIKSTAPDVRRRLSEAAPNKRKPLLQAHVREQAIRVLGLSASYTLDTRQPLREIGMDSLMAVELRNALGASFQQKLPSTLLFDYPTVEVLTDFLAQELWPEAKPASENDVAEAKPIAATAAATAEVEKLSDEEAEALLLAELEAMKTDKKKRS